LLGQPSVGIALTNAPNPNAYSGVLLIFDANATTGNVTQDKALGKAYVEDVILPAIESGMRVALIVDPNSSIGQATLFYLGIMIPVNFVSTPKGIVAVPACAKNVKPVIPPKDYPIYNGVNALPGACCMVPIVPDVVAPVSVGSNGKYCVVVRLTKLGDEMIIMSWNGIFRDISSNPSVQTMLKNVILYLAKELPAKYPKTPYTVTKTVTETTTYTTTLINNVTVVMTVTSTATTTLTLTKTVTTTLYKTLTETLTTTLYSTVTLWRTLTTTVTEFITNTTTITITSVSNVTLTVTKTITTTLFKTLYSTITTTTVEYKTDVKSVAGAAVAGIILGLIIGVAAKGAGGRKKEEISEW
jgi:hypothetical protein